MAIIHNQKSSLRNITILLFLLVFTLLPAGCSGSSKVSSGAGYRHVEVYEAAELIGTEGSILVDVRTEIPFKMEHIPGAVNIPYTEIPDDPEEPVEGLPDKDQLIILYCDYGGTSKEVAEIMVSKGYTNIVEFDGLKVWEGETVSSDS